jgi:hypothetical protein
VGGDVGTRDDADHAGQRERPGGVDCADARVCEGRAHDRRAGDVGQRVEIVDEPALAAQEGIVLDAQRRAADVSRRLLAWTGPGCHVPG